MNDDWLWDGAPPEGTDDARIAATLRGLARDRPCPALPDRVEPSARPHRATRRVGWGLGAALAAAGLLVLLTRPGTPEWGVRALSGADPCSGASCTLDEGEELVTDGDGRLEILVGDIGVAHLGPHSRLARVPSEAGKVLRLDAGTLDVSVIAPPRDLRVLTPAAEVVDLGCAYALSVDADATHLSVSNGSVSLENDHGISIVTAGSVARATAGARPDLPLRDDALPAFATALRTLEAGLEAGPSAADLEVLLAAARPEDLFTLWHVLQLVPASQRGAVLDTAARLAPGAAADRAALLRLEGRALEQWWQELVPFALGP